MNLKNTNIQHKVFLVGTILLLAGIIPYIIFFSGTLPPEDEGETEGTENFTPSNRTLPDDFFTNITSIKFVKGDNASSNDLDELKFKDDDFYELEGEWTGVEYEYDIRFFFSDNLSNFRGESFNLFLYLDIDVCTNEEPVDFEVFSCHQWENISRIKLDEIHLEREFYKNTTSFRVFGTTSTQKTIPIDRITVLLQNNKYMSNQNLTTQSVEMLEHGEEGVWTDYREDSNWWASAGDDKQLEQYAYIYTGGSGYSRIWLKARVKLGNTSVFAFTGAKLELYTNARDSLLSGEKYFYNSFRIYNFTRGGWESRFDVNGTYYTPKNFHIVWEDFPGFQVEDMINKSDCGYYWMYYIEVGTVNPIATRAYLLHNAVFSEVKTLGGNLTIESYPNITRVYPVPESPIDTLETLEIRANVKFPHAIIRRPIDVECLIRSKTRSWNSGWLAMTNNSYYWSLEVEVLDLSNDVYEAWVNVSVAGHFIADFPYLSSINATDFVIANFRPVISFVNPENHEMIDFFYDLNINVSVVDLEDDLYTDVSFKMYSADPDDPEIDWTSMDKHNPLNPDYWNYSINPIDYINDNYTIRVRARDERGYGYNSIEVMIHNDRPGISFVKPVDAETITTENYTIVVDVSDSEADPISDVSVTIYSNLDTPILNWTSMIKITLYRYSYDFVFANHPNSFYFIKVRARDEKGYGYEDILISTIYSAPHITIIKPDEFTNELTTPLSHEIRCNITSDLVLKSVKWGIMVPSQNSPSNWDAMEYVSRKNNSYTYKDMLNLLNYEYGTYYLVINASNTAESSFKLKVLSLHPILTYNIKSTSITYKSSSIIVRVDGGETTEITASFGLTHDPLVKERDWEVYISEEYSDAHSYYLNRGYSSYYPTGLIKEGVWTSWRLPGYAASDIIHFQLEKPKLSNSAIKDEEDMVYEQGFSLSSRHRLTDITVKNELEKYFPDPENVEFTLYHKYGDEWVEYDEGLKVEADAFVLFEFYWDELEENSTVQFKFVATRLEVEESNLTAWLIFGGVMGGFVEFLWIMFGYFVLKKHEDWGNLKFILISVAVGVGAFFGGFGIGYVAYPNP